VIALRLVVLCGVRQSYALPPTTRNTASPTNSPFVTVPLWREGALGAYGAGPRAGPHGKGASRRS